MTIQATTTACASCGGPTKADPRPPELEQWAGLARPVCALCVAAAEALDEQREAAERTRRRAELREQRLLRVGVPEHLAGYGFADIDRPEGLDAALKKADAWAKGELQGFGLFGPNGTGKTRVGVAAANEACWRAQVHWYSAPVLIARLGDGGFESPARKKALAVLTGTGPLVLDDLDKVRPKSEFAAQHLFMAIDGRCDGGGQLAVTTNLQGPELLRRWPQPYGVAIVDRLKMLSWACCAGESKRWTDRRVAA